MSRNLLSETCTYCGENITLDEDPRPVTAIECGVYFDEYRSHLIVANATCWLCCAKYLAWIQHHRLNPNAWRDEKFKKGYTGPVPDLSFRSTFNDEPGPDDLPKYKTTMVKYRTGPWNEKDE